MSDINLEFIDRYQRTLKKDVNSRVFAPLAEAYRKLGMLNEALPIAEAGVERNPKFSSGRVALGRILTDMGRIDEALKEFKKAAELSPDNILAHNCLGKTYLRLRQPKLALSSYKMVLFLSPNDHEAKKVIEKLESLTADDYEDDVFARIDLKKIELKKHHSETPLTTDGESAQNLDFLSEKDHRSKLRALSLIDALIIRNEIEKAVNLLDQTKRNFGTCDEIEHRLNMIQERTGDPEEEPSPIKPLSYDQLAKEQKVDKLHRLLKTVAAHKKNDAD